MTNSASAPRIDCATGEEPHAAGPDSVLRKHTSLVRRIAHHVVRRLPSHVEVDDLIQAGFLGLLEALRNFAATRNASFETYAGIRIRGAIIDFLRQGNWAPRILYGRLRSIAAATGDIESKKGCAATAAEVAAELGLSLEEYHRILQDGEACRTESLQGVRTRGGYSLSEVLPDRSADITEDLERQQLREALAAAIDELPERERAVILLYYREDLCLREIGNMLNVTESRICQIRALAIERLRKMAARWIADELPSDSGKHCDSQRPAGLG